MATFNQVVLVGNLTRDVEIRFAPSSGTAIGSFGLAVNEQVKDGEGWKDYANFFDITVFGKTAEACAEHLAKGRSVLVAGRLRHERWEKDGQKHNRVKVLADKVQFLGSKPEAAKAKAAPPAEDDDIPF
ncbi:MAG: single-stranded DNA-binding protein [Deltaproteobacteria bacterium]|nr:single-stranded DNA-binding protein [Deltaproteobacteria bacterium]